MNKQEKINEIIRLMTYKYGKHFVIPELITSLKEATDIQLDHILDWQQNKKYRQPVYEDFKKGFRLEIFDENIGDWRKVQYGSDKHPTEYHDYPTEEELNNPNKYRVEL